MGKWGLYRASIGITLFVTLLGLCMISGAVSAETNLDFEIGAPGSVPANWSMVTNQSDEGGPIGDHFYDLRIVNTHNFTGSQALYGNASVGPRYSGLCCPAYRSLTCAWMNDSVDTSWAANVTVRIRDIQSYHTGGWGWGNYIHLVFTDGVNSSPWPDLNSLGNEDTNQTAWNALFVDHEMPYGPNGNHYNFTYLGSDGQQWYVYTRQIPSNINKSHMKVGICWKALSWVWDGTTANNQISSVVDNITFQAAPLHFIAEPPTKYNITGHAYDNYEHHLPGVLVQNGSFSNVTDANGTFSLGQNFTNGVYNLTFSKPGFNTDYQEVVIDNEDGYASAYLVDDTPPSQVVLSNDTPKQTTVNLTWTTASDPNLWGYEVFKDGVHLAFTNKTYYNGTDLSPSTTYEFKVRANDTYNNWGSNSSILNVTTASNPPPLAISRWNNKTGSSLTLSTAVNESVEFGITYNQEGGIDWYNNDVWASGNEWNNTDNYTTSWPEPGTYLLNVSMTNENGTSQNTTWIISVADLTPPAQVTGLSNDTPTQTSVNLLWTANSEGDLWGYEVFRDGVHLAYTQNNYYNVTGLSPTTTYQFIVRANDTANNWGLNSTALSVRTAGLSGSYIWPFSVNATLRIGDSIAEHKTVVITTTIPKADIIFAFDLTGSMGGQLSTAKAKALDIMNNLSDQIGDPHFAVMSFMDYPHSYNSYGYSASYGGGGDYAYRLNHNMTGDKAAISSAINSLYLGGGNDGPESYTRVLYESYADAGIGYRAGAKKIIIMFGDNVPHDNNLNEGIPDMTYSWSTGGDPGRDEVMFTADDLDLQNVLNQMKANDVTLLAIWSYGSYEQYWSQWVNITGGAYYSLGTPADIPKAIQTLVEEEARHISLLELRTTPGYEAWLFSTSPQNYTNLDVPEGGITKTFDIVIKVPVNTSPGLYIFNISAVGDGASYGDQLVNITVPAFIEETKRLDNVTANETYSFEFNLTVVKVTVTVNKNLSDVYMTVQDYGTNVPPDALSIGAGDKVFCYFNISTNISQDDITGVTITFNVSKSWIAANGLDPNKITLNRYRNGVWETYPAVMIGEDTDSITYSVTLPGLSTFAITAPVPPIPTPTPTPTARPSLKGKYYTPSATPTHAPTAAPTQAPTPAPTATPSETPLPSIPGMPLTGPAELPPGTTYGMHVFMGTNWIYNWGVVPVAAIGSETPIEIKHTSSIPLFMNMTQFNGSQIEFSISGNNTTIICSISGLPPLSEYLVVDEDLTHNVAYNFTVRADSFGNLKFTLTLASTHRVAITQTPLSVASGVLALSAVGTAIATAGSIALSKAGTSVSQTGIGKFDVLRELFEKGLKLKDVAFEVVEEAALEIEARALPAVSFESMVKLSGVEDAYIGYAVVVLFAASAVEAWIANNFQITIILAGALLAITGYLGHEFMDKYMAMRYKSTKKFKSSLLGGVITIASSAIGASVAPLALGEVHDEPLTKKQRMLVTLSGTMVNVLLAAVFIALSLILPYYQPYFITGITLNLAMAVAALLPVGFMEGKRVWDYSKLLCIFMLFATIAMQLFTSIILG